MSRNAKFQFGNILMSSLASLSTALCNLLFHRHPILQRMTVTHYQPRGFVSAYSWVH